MLKISKYKKAGINTIAYGDIFLEDLKEYRINSLKKIAIKSIYPIWKTNTKENMENFINLGFKAIITCVDLKVLDRSFVGKVIDNDFLNNLPEGVDPCGENGEYHSFVYDGPIFNKSVDFIIGEKKEFDGFYFCDLIPIEKAK